MSIYGDFSKKWLQKKWFQNSYVQSIWLLFCVFGYFWHFRVHKAKKVRNAHFYDTIQQEQSIKLNYFRNIKLYQFSQCMARSKYCEKTFHHTHTQKVNLPRISPKSILVESCDILSSNVVRCTIIKEIGCANQKNVERGERFDFLFNTFFLKLSH